MPKRMGKDCLEEHVESMKWLVAGCGSIGRRHLGNLRNLGQTELTVYRSRRTGVEEIEGEFGVRSFFSLDDALADLPDVVLVANPTSLHVPVALEAASAGRHIFIEKPVSDSLDGTAELATLVRTNGVTAAVGYNLRFHPVVRKLKDMVDNGSIGDILSVRAWAGQYLPDWHPREDYRASYVARSELGGGVILTLSHELDYLYWLFGDVAEVAATVSQPSELEMDTESLAEITLVFKTGTVGQVHLDCLNRRPGRGCELIGSRGTLRCDLNRAEIMAYMDGAGESQRIPVPLADPNRMYVDELAHFIGCVSAGQEPMVPLREGIAVLEIALAARRSVVTGMKQLCH